MSTSSKEIQAMFDDMTLFVAEIIPSFKADALRHLEGKISFEEFEQNYGKEAGKFLLKIAEKFNNAEENIRKNGIEIFSAQELNGFATDDLLPIIEHWFKNRPEVFRALLHQYPEVFSFLRKISNLEVDKSGRLSKDALKIVDNLTDEANTYRPSCILSAEYLGAKRNRSKIEHEDFCQCANSSLTAVLGMAELLRKAYDLRLISLNETEVLSEADKVQAQRDQIPVLVKKREQYSIYGCYNGEWKETLLEPLPQDELELLTRKSLNFQAGETIHVVSKTMLDNILSRGHTLRRYVFLEAYSGHGPILFDTDLSKKELEKRQQKSEQGAEKALEFLIKIRQTEVNNSTINGKSTQTDIAEYNEGALKLAILRGDESFEMIVAKKWLKRTVKVSDIIGIHPSRMAAAEKLEAADNSEDLKKVHAIKLIKGATEDMQARITALGKFYAEDDPKKAKIHGAASRGLSILNGDPLYTRAPQRSHKGESLPAAVSPNNEVELERVNVTEKLELFRRHYKENKALLSGGLTEKLANFIKVVKNFVTKKLDDLEARKSSTQEQNSAPNIVDHKRKSPEEGIKLSTIAAAFLANHPTILPNPDAIKIPGREPPRIA